MNDLIFFSDITTFHVSGRVHKQNFQIWSEENPNTVDEYNDHSQKVNVWCAMSSECIIGPFFFDEPTIKGQNYLKMLKEFFHPVLAAKKRIVKRKYF